MALLTGCTNAAEDPTTDAAIGTTDLSKVCPEKIVVQTDWFHTADHGHLFELLGSQSRVDAERKAIVGPLYSHGEYTGVSLEIRSGGPAIGGEQVSSQMYTDPSINLGYVKLSDVVATSSKTPLTAVYAGLEKSPLVLMWDPATYPDVASIADLGKTDAKVLYFNGSSYMNYLTSAGILKAEQVDGSYDGTPATFVAAGGADAQQDYATNGPYTYQHEVPDWNKPVDYQLVYDAGFPEYASLLTVRNDDLAGMSDCLRAFVPVLQRGTVDFYDDPAPVLDVLVKANDEYRGGVYTRETADYAVKTARELGLASNGTNGTVGDIDAARAARMFEIIAPITTADGAPPSAGLVPDQLYNNEFIDPTIGFQ